MAESSVYALSSSSSSNPSNCCFGIELTREISTYNVTGRPQAQRMRVEVTDYNNVDPNIFVYKRNEPDPNTDTYRDTFEAVASPNDIEELPAGAPRDDSPYFRLSEIDVMSRSMDMLNETWALILADRDELIRTLTYTCELDVDAVSQAGCWPDDDDDVTPTPDVEPESSSAPTCPDDDYDEIEIVASDDPDFPVGTVFTEVSGATPPLCQREWEATGIVSGKKLELTTSLVDNTFTCDRDGVPQDTGNISDEYKTFIYYSGDADEDFTIQIAGVEGSS